MAEEAKSIAGRNSGDDSWAFWATARDSWVRATADSGSVKRNLAMLAGVTVAVLLCIWSVGGILVLILGGVHVWTLSGAGIGVASIAGGVWTRQRRRRHKPGPDTRHDAATS